MNSGVLFESDFRCSFPFGRIMTFAGASALLVYLMLRLRADAHVFAAMLLLPVIVLLTVLFFLNITQYHRAKLQVTPEQICFVRKNGKALRTIPLRTVQEVRLTGDDSAMLKLRPDPTFWNRKETVVESLVGIENAADFAEIILKQTELLRDSQQHAADADLPPDQEIPHDAAAEKADTDALHAAEYLLNQGMISEQQFGNLLASQKSQPEQSVQTGDINAQNAADDLQRQAMLAQQPGTVPQSDESEKEKEYGRAGFV